MIRPSFSRELDLTVPTAWEQLTPAQYESVLDALSGAPNETAGRLIAFCRLAGLISEEQVEHLRAMQWIFANRTFRLAVTDLNTAEMPLPPLCREYLTAEVVSHMDGVETLWRGSLRTNAAVIIDYVTRHEFELPIYAASSVAEANRTKPYENQANDPTFFFA